MKKCTSCSKDLPDAALHCVFCGAKQPAAAAPQAGLAKTVMGYSAQEMIQQIRQQGASVPGGGTPGAPPANAPPSTFAPAQPAAAHSGASRPQPSPAHVQQTSPMAATIAPTGANALNISALNPPPAMPSAPPAASQNPQFAATMAPQQNPQHLNPQLAATIAPQQMSPFAPPPGNPGAALGTGPMTGGPTGGSLGHGIGHGTGSDRGAGPSVGGPATIGGGGVLTGSQPIVMEPPPAHATPPPAATRPIIARAAEADDALGGSVKGMMLIAGILLIVAFVVPTTTDPMAFPFEGLKSLGDLPTPELLSTLVVPVVGVLALLLAFLPLGASARGALAFVLGLAGLGVVAYAMRVFDRFEWQVMVMLVGELLIYAGLVARSAFTGSMIARIFATIGALAVLATLLVPDHDGIPLVDLFKGFSGGTSDKVLTVTMLASVLLAVLALLAWLPAPSGAGAKLLAWLGLAFTLATLSFLQPSFVITIAGWLTGDIGAVAKAPGALLAWAPVTAFLGLAGWGLAGVVGRPS